MKLLFNIEPLIGESTGVGIYTARLMAALDKHPLVESIHMFAGHRNLSRYSESFLESDNNDLASRPRRFAFTQFIPTRLLWSISRLLFWIKTLHLRDHVYIETNFVLRPFIGQSVLFCHDLSVVRYREFHPAGRVEYFDRYLARSIKDCDVVATISPAIAKEILKKFGRACKLIVPPAAFQPSVTDDATASSQEPVPAKNYILSVGSLEPRKNLEGLLNAFELLSEGMRKQHPLVFVGPSGWKNESLLGRIKSLADRGEAYQLGYVQNSQLAKLYSGATLFAYLSHYEGFGIPVIEAMASGVPVLINNDPALVDTAGGAAEIVDGSNATDVSETLKRLIENPTLRSELRSRGYKNIERFSWKKSANTLIDALQEMAQE